MSAEEIARGLKEQIAEDAHRAALLPRSLRDSYELEWRAILERTDHV